MTWTKAILALGLGGAIICGAAGASVAGIIAAHPTGVERDAATTIEVRYRRHHFYRRGGGYGYNDPARTHRPMDVWDRYGKRWD